MANSDRRQRAASTSAEPLTTPRRPDEQSRCRTHRRHLTEARRAPGASRSSLLASSPPVAKAKGTDAKRASRDALYPGDFIPESQAKSSRNAERHQIGMVREIIPESRATSVGSRTLGTFANDVLVASKVRHGVEPIRGTPPRRTSRYRRVSPIAVRPGKGLLAEPI